MTTSISIVGAGIAGLTLGRSLLRRGIPAVLYEKAASKPRFNYGITLHATAYKSLLSILDIDEDTFKRRVAVDADSDGVGRIGSSINIPDHSGRYNTVSSFRANRNKLEQLLREGLDIRWEHTLQSIEPSAQGTQLKFQNGEVAAAKIIVAADGVHSSLRNMLIPSTQPHVLPYIAFNGKRRLDRSTFNAVYSPAMRDENVAEARHGDAVLHVSINETKEQGISLSWIYSRPVRSQSDVLHQPNRSKQDATKIPEELFDEIRALDALQPPFSDVFDPDKMRGDRVLHWLMRSMLVPLPELHSVLAKTGVCFMGEAAHAEPIVGGNGANAAILDAVSLAERIAGGDRESFSKWYNEVYSGWKKGVEQSEQSIGNIHHVVKAGAGNL